MSGTPPPRGTGPGAGTRRPGDTAAARQARYWRALNRLADLSEADTAVGLSPADRVFTHGRLTLWRYRRPRSAPLSGPPLVILHGFVGRASVTDLAPGRSLVADLLARGADVFTIHWGSPSRADRFLRIEDYLEDHVAACLDHVADVTGRRPAVLGICEGGIFAACLAALEPERLAGLALAVTPIDCHADPDAVVTRWVRAFSPDDLCRLIDSLGGLPGGTLSAAFQAMTPGRTMAKYTAGLRDMADDRDGLHTFLRMETWLRDRPDHPGEAAKQLLVDLYHENRLARGVLRLGGRRVDLSALRLPILTAWGEADHIVPPPCATAILRLAPHAVHTPCPLPAGHIGIFVSRRARGLLGARLAGWLDGLDRPGAARGTPATEAGTPRPSAGPAPATDRPRPSPPRT